MQRFILIFVASGLITFGASRSRADDDREPAEPIAQNEPALNEPALNEPAQNESAQLDAGPEAASHCVTILGDALQSLALEKWIAAIADCKSIVEQLDLQSVRAQLNDRSAKAVGVWRLASAERAKLVVKPNLPIAPELAALRDKIHKAVANYEQRPLNAAQQSPWEVMHRIVAYGIGTEIRRDGPTGDKVNAIGWLLWGNRAASEPLMVVSAGRPLCRVGPGLQGHPGQFLGMLAQSQVSILTPFQLDGHSFTVADLVEQEKADCSTHIELTFKLIALSYYLPSNETWIAKNGERWSISRLVQEEIQQPLRTGACGGTHRLFSLSNAYRYRAKQGLPIDGEFKRAEKYVRDYHRYTLGALQNPDGSFSTEWFTKPANADDPARKIQTTGHMMEWLAQSLPDSELRDPRAIKTIDFLATQLSQDPVKDWSVGPLGHALHALIIYDQRAFGEANPAIASSVAKANRPANMATRPLYPPVPRSGVDQW